MTDELVGKWKNVPKENKNYDEFMKALGITEDKIEKWRNLEAVVEQVKDGDGWKSIVEAGEYKKTICWKVGEEYQTQSLQGEPVKSTPRLEGKVMVEKMITETANGPQEVEIRATIDGNRMTRVFNYKGVEMTQYMVKC